MNPHQPFDPSAWARARRAWAQGGPLPWLHTEVARRMAGRLSVIRTQPAVVLEWDALAGQSRDVLQSAYPQARWLPVECSGASLSAARCAPGATAAAGPHAAPQGRPGAWLRGALHRLKAGWGGRGPDRAAPGAADRQLPGFLEGEVPEAHGQLLWSNLGLHTHADTAATLASWRRALSVDGFLMFSTFGPDTLRELRPLWAAAGWGPPAQAFADMHDWGDALVRAGFADPVMDQEPITLTWADAQSALAELRTLGRNAHCDRQPGLRTPGWRQRLLGLLAAQAGPDGRISLTFEVVYGHAFKPVPRPRVAPTTEVSLQDMRALVQSARPPQ